VTEEKEKEFDGKAENARTAGQVRGLAMSKAIFEDNFDRQAVLQERTQRERTILQTRFSSDLMLVYHKAYVRALCEEGPAAIAKEDEKAGRAHAEKVQDWISSLRTSSLAARTAGSNIADKLIESAITNDMLALKSWLEEEGRLLEVHRGIQRREYESGFWTTFVNKVNAVAVQRGIDPDDVYLMLKEVGVVGPVKVGVPSQV
jgi:hypothetical protein